MGSARIEIFRRAGKHDRYPGSVMGTPLQVEAALTTTTAALDPEDRVAINANARYNDLTVRITGNEDMYVTCGADPTVSATTGYLIKSGVPFEFQAREGELIDVMDVA